MKTGFQKLRSESGASIILALVFLLICLSVGAMILASASVNIHKETSARDQQEQYLSIASAARLLKSAYADSECTMSESRTVYTCGYAEHNPFTTPAAIDNTNKLTAASYDVFRAAAEFDNWGSGFTAKTFNVAPDNNHSGDMKNVSVAFSMDANYNATFVLTAAGDDTKAYAVTLTFKAAVTKNTSYQNGECTHSETDNDGNRYDASYPYTVTMNTTSVKWDGGEITKGAAK